MEQLNESELTDLEKLKPAIRNKLSSSEPIENTQDINDLKKRILHYRVNSQLDEDYNLARVSTIRPRLIKFNAKLNFQFLNSDREGYWSID